MEKSENIKGKSLSGDKCDSREAARGERKREVTIADSVKDAMRILKQHEDQHTVRYNLWCSPKNFGETDVYAEKHKIMWQSKHIPFTGIPFVVLSNKILDCHHGQDRNKILKNHRKRKKMLEVKFDHYYKKDYMTVQDTKKFDCPAIATLSEIAMFPTYKIDANNEWQRRSVSQALRRDLGNKSIQGTFLKKIAVIIDDVTEHTNHATGKNAGISQEIDPRLSAKIVEYAADVKSVMEMKRLLKLQVKSEILGDKTIEKLNNRRFYPTNHVIESHMVRARKKLQLAMIDQESLGEKIEEWRKEDKDVNIFFRPKSNDFSKNTDDTVEEKSLEDDWEDELDDEVKFESDDTGKTLLFVCQAKWHCGLLRRYGTEMLLLDATYRTTRYILPLFFLVVTTNVDYQIVGIFVTENESTSSIMEALKYFQVWNSGFQPHYCMVDFCNEEINALEQTFPGCNVLICDFHREQAWDRWLSKKVNGCTDKKDEVLPKLRRIDHARTVQHMEDAITAMKNSEFWTTEYEKLVSYLTKYWFKIKERWVWAYRQGRILVNLNTNNGVERQNESFKYSYLQRRRNSSLTGMLTTLIEEFIVDKYESYSEANFKMDGKYRKYSSQVPNFLSDRPRDFVKHALHKISLSKTVDLSGIKVTGIGKFSIKTENDLYYLSFGDKNTMSSCTCPSWVESCYPCKHFYAVFAKYPTWQWEAMSPLYKNSPFLTLDYENTYFEKEEESKDEIFGHTPHTSENNLSIQSKNMNELSSEEKQLKTLDALKPKYCHQSFRNDCAELLGLIRNLTFEVSYDVLSNVHGQLSQIVSTMENNTQKEQGVIIRQSISHVGTRKTKYKDLVKHKKRKFYANRCGSYKDKMVAASSIQVDENKSSKSEGHIEETVSDMNMHVIGAPALVTVHKSTENVFNQIQICPLSQLSQHSWTLKTPSPSLMKYRKRKC